MRRSILLAAFVAALALAGCDGDAASPAPEEAAESIAAQVEEAVRTLASEADADIEEVEGAIEDLSEEAVDIVEDVREAAEAADDEPGIQESPAT